MCKRVWVFVHGVREGPTLFPIALPFPTFTWAGTPSAQPTQPHCPHPCVYLPSLLNRTSSRHTPRSANHSPPAGRTAFYLWDGTGSFIYVNIWIIKIKTLGQFWAYKWMLSPTWKKKKGFPSFDPFKLSCLLSSLWEGKHKNQKCINKRIFEETY